jgi:hypothetical protein
VKVADFGTGRIMANLVGIEGGDLPRSARLGSALSVDSVDSNTSFIEAARTLSRGDDALGRCVAYPTWPSNVPLTRVDVYVC